MSQIPELLLGIPAPHVSDKYVQDGRLHLSVEEAERLSRQYMQEVSQYLISNSFSVEEDVLPAVAFGMRIFNAENFTGELTPSERERFAAIYSRFGASTESPTDLTSTYLQRLLTRDGEMPAPSLRMSGLLLCMLAIISAREGEDFDAVPLIPLHSIWRVRVHFRHQLSLSRRAHSVFLAISTAMDAIMAQADADISVEDLIEVGHVQNYYHHRDLAAETFRRAMRKSGLQLEESAMLGVRTRWQQHQLVQMIVDAKSSRPLPQATVEGEDEQPEIIQSEVGGHDLLDRPRERPEAEPLAITPLHPQDKAIVLALCMDIRNNNPYHGLTQHHMQTYMERLVADPAPPPFVIESQVLLVRARLEMNRSRVQQRAFLQLAELNDQFSAQRNPSHQVFGRTGGEYFYSVAYPSIWSLKREYADGCYDELMYKTALDIYEQILHWEKIIECCKRLDKRRRAESLARQLLEQDPLNPMLWVALGEATHEEAPLWKAWELCSHTMAAPMRALAKLALERQQYDKVLEYFDEAVKINPIFGGDWFTLGYAALKLKRWDRGGEAFTRACQMNPNDAFAWNNLATIMMYKQKLRPAFNAMSQALRNNRRDWRMWMNYFQMGCELKEVVETTHALGIALDIAQKQLMIDPATLMLFTHNNIAYLKGEISGSSIDAEEDPTSKRDALRYRSMQNDAPEDHLAALPLDANEEEGGADDEDYTDLAPLAADVEMPATFFPSRAAPDAAHEEAVRQGLRARHAGRLRALFRRLLDLFVSNPDLYRAAAVLFRFLDGPIAGYRYRVKELRACEQKDQWQREDALFSRTVDCLADTVEDILAALDEARNELESTSGPAAQQPAAPALDGATETPASQANAEDAPPPRLRGAALHAAVLDALKLTQGNVKAALEAAAENMESKPDFARLRAVSARVRSGLQEAKATFV